MSKQGFDNETSIRESIHNKRFYDINDNLKKNLLAKIHPSVNENDIFFCEKKGGSAKPDILIKINQNKYFISIKTGSGNSVHQENIDEFISFLDEETNLTIEIANNLRYFIWGDGTLDGSADFNQRKNANTIIKENSKLTESLQNYFNRNKEILIDRFIKTGADKNSEPADYIYYGSKLNGIASKSDKVVGYLSGLKKRPLSVGGLNFQAWNRILDGNKNFEWKRGDIQLKWGNIEKDLIACDK